MYNHRKNRLVLAISVALGLSGVAHAAEDSTTPIPDPLTTSAESLDPASQVVETAEAATPSSVVGSDGTSANSPTAFTANTDPTSPQNQPATPTMVPEAQKADAALQQKEGDATAQTNLDQVFKASERTYSLSKKGSIAGSYDLDYSYYRDTRLDLALDDSSSVITRLRIGEEAQHTITNTFELQYGLLDNLTVTASLPLVARSDVTNDRATAGLGDINFGARWEPFPLERGKLPLILFGSLSTRTGDSPYEINPNFDLSTGKGYYAIGGGASTRKFIDPIVLFGSASLNYGFKESGLNQLRGTSSGILTDFEPGITGGMSVGFAYSLNYDVSLTMSYQQSFASGSEFKFSNGNTNTPADQTSASMNFSLGVRVSPKTIVNGSVGFGLTEDAPDVSLGLSFPLDFVDFSFPLDRIGRGVFGK
mgnify:CR=1 FL=1